MTDTPDRLAQIKEHLSADWPIHKAGTISREEAFYLIACLEASESEVERLRSVAKAAERETAAEHSASMVIGSTPEERAASRKVQDNDIHDARRARAAAVHRNMPEDPAKQAGANDRSGESRGPVHPDDSQ